MNISSGSIKLGIASILVGLVGVYLVQVYMAKEEPVVAEPPEPMTVPLASMDLPVGREIRLGDVGLTKMTSAQMVERGWDLTSVMLSPEQVIGRTLKTAQKRGQPFLTSEFYPEGSGPNPLERLKPGYRAVDIQVPPELGGGVVVGDRVDVIFRSTPQKPSETQTAVPEVTVLLASGMEVIDVRNPMISKLQNAVGYKAKMPTVTLAATPEEAKKFSVVRDRGEISLIALAPNETSLANQSSDEQVTFNDVLGIQPPPQVAVQQFNTVIYRRGKAQLNSFVVPRQPGALAPPPVDAQPIPPSVPDAEPPQAPDVAPPILPPLPEDPAEK